jgi:hypothetical protein
MLLANGGKLQAILQKQNAPLLCCRPGENEVVGNER